MQVKIGILLEKEVLVTAMICMFKLIHYNSLFLKIFEILVIEIR